MATRINPETGLREEGFFEDGQWVSSQPVASPAMDAAPPRPKAPASQPQAGREFIDADARESFREPLYEYLQDKARRRFQTTSGRAYQDRERQIQQDEGLEQGAALIGGISQDMSKLGSFHGNVAQSSMPQFAAGLNKATQNRYDRETDLRAMEEGALGTDIRMAQAIAGMDDSKAQRDMARTRLYDDLADRASQRGMDVRKQEETERANLAREKILGRPRADRSAGTTYRIVPGKEGPNGEMMGYNPRTNKVEAVDVSGFKDKPKTAAEKPLTSDERSASMFYNNAESALRVLEEMEAKGYRPKGTTALKGMLPDAVQGYALSEDEAKYKQAAEDYTAAKLRLESGAAIPQAEIAQQARIYMALPGESDQLLQNKQASRRKALQGLEFKAGRGAEKIRQMGDPSPAPRPDEKNTQQPWFGDSGGKVVKKFYSPSKNKTKLIYEDGREEIVDGQR